MEVLTVLLVVTVLVAVLRTLIAVFRDGRGHTPPVHSHDPWKAGNLPSEPYTAFNAWYVPGAWMR